MFQITSLMASAKTYRQSALCGSWLHSEMSDHIKIVTRGWLINRKKKKKISIHLDILLDQELHKH